MPLPFQVRMAEAEQRRAGLRALSARLAESLGRLPTVRELCSESGYGYTIVYQDCRDGKVPSALDRRPASEKSPEYREATDRPAFAPREETRAAEEHARPLRCTRAELARIDALLKPWKERLKCPL